MAGTSSKAAGSVVGSSPSRFWAAGPPEVGGRSLWLGFVTGMSPSKVNGSLQDLPRVLGCDSYTKPCAPETPASCVVGLGCPLLVLLPVFRPSEFGTRRSRQSDVSRQ